MHVCLHSASVWYGGWEWLFWDGMFGAYDPAFHAYLNCWNWIEYL